MMTQKEIKYGLRNSRLILNDVYFWTQEHWSLVTKPEDYVWSSAKFYETGIDDFKIITDYRERF